MKFIISENRMMLVIEEFIKTLKPNFNQDKTGVYKGLNTAGNRYIRFYDPDTGERFAKYFPDFKEIQLENEIYDALETTFGYNLTLFIDWFNKEFGQDAEMVNSY